MREATVQNIRDQVRREFAEPDKTSIGVSPPRSRMNLVNVLWRVQPIEIRAIRHPNLIIPGRIRCARGARRIPGAQFVALRVRIGFKKDFSAIPAQYLVFVKRSFRNAGNEQFPDPAGFVHSHRMHSPIPSVETTRYADTGGVGRPDGETNAGYAINFYRVGTEGAIGLPHAPLMEQIQVVLGNARRKGIRVVYF